MKVKYRVATVGSLGVFYRVQVWRVWWPFWVDTGARHLDTPEQAYRAIEMLKDEK